MASCLGIEQEVVGRNGLADGVRLVPVIVYR